MTYLDALVFAVVSYFALGLIMSGVVAGHVDPKARTDWQCYKENWRLAVEVFFTWPRFL